MPIAQATEAEAAEHEAAARAALEQREAAAAAAARAQAEAVRAPTVMQLHCTSAQLALGVVHSCLSRACVPCNQCIR